MVRSAFAAFRSLVSEGEGRADSKTRWLLEATLLIFLFFTASGSRRWYYILPILPFCSLLCAVFLAQGGWEKWKNGVLALIRVVLVAGSIFAVLSPAVWPVVEKFSGFAAPMAFRVSLPACGLFALLVWGIARRPSFFPESCPGFLRALVGPLSMVVVLMGGFFLFQFPALDSLRTAKEFSMRLGRQAASIPSESIVFYPKDFAEVVYYAGRPEPFPVFSGKQMDDLRGFLSDRRPCVLITSRKYREYLFPELPEGTLSETPTLEELARPWEKKRNLKDKLQAWILPVKDGANADE
jgi:hypothetical protein